jgi:hypothetical protein
MNQMIMLPKYGKITFLKRYQFSNIRTINIQFN